jgi:hypothetical protein
MRRANRTQAVRTHKAIQVFEERGVVLRVEGNVIAVDTGDTVHEARRAVSCLVEPVPGDLVLVAVGEDGRNHVLAVLEREAGAPSRLAMEGNVTVKVTHGRFVVAADEGIDLVTGREVNVAAAGVGITAHHGSVVLDKLAYVGRAVQAEVERLKHVGSVLDSVLDRVSQRVKRSFRTVEELEQVRAEAIDYSAKKNMHLHGHNALVSAEELVKVDGEQIHLG